MKRAVLAFIDSEPWDTWSALAAGVLMTVVFLSVFHAPAVPIACTGVAFFIFSVIRKGRQ